MKSEEEIRILLGKFYDGETSFEEERLIDEFFLKEEDVSTDLCADKELFDVLREQTAGGDICVPDTLEQELSAVVDRNETNHVAKSLWLYNKQIVGIAASVALVVTIAMYLGRERDNDSINVPYYTETENVYIPQTEIEAAAEVSRALILVSDKLNQASDNVVYTSCNSEEYYF